MSDDAKMTPRQLLFGVFKIAIMMTVGLLLAAVLLSSVFAVAGGRVSNVALNALLIAIAVSLLASGVLTILKILDWFEARRLKRNSR